MCHLWGKAQLKPVLKLNIDLIQHLVFDATWLFVYWDQNRTPTFYILTSLIYTLFDGQSCMEGKKRNGKALCEDRTGPNVFESISLSCVMLLQKNLEL